jgi:glutathione S-transferase
VSDAGGKLRVWGSVFSYFTGKLEGYLRYKEIPYEHVPAGGGHFSRTLPRKIGVVQLPAVELPDGRWISDTTPIIAWLEEQHPEPAVVPKDPLQAFVSRLVEDHADEWLWRPAMHYRWSYAASRANAGAGLARELAGHIPLPVALKRHYVAARQLGLFVRGDGVRKETRAHVEQGYFRALEQLSGIFSRRPYLLGDRPSLADIGYFGPMFRHFASDPVPADIMRERAPAVYEWVARLWNARASEVSGELLSGIPGDWGPILEEIGATHLEQLAANAAAWTAGRAHFEMTVQGVRYRNLPTSRYRVWCLEELRRHLDALPEAPREEARGLLERHGCWEPLWRIDPRPSGHDPEGRAPFSSGMRVFAATQIRPADLV